MYSRTVLSLSALLAFSLFNANGRAAEPPLTIDLAGARSLALQNNRPLKVAELEVDRAKSRLRWSGRLSNPELELGASTDQFGLDEDEGSLEVAFIQHFPVTSKLRDEREVRRVEVVLAEAEIAARQRDILVEVDKAAVTLLALERLNEHRLELVELNEEIVTYLDEGAKKGEISPLDVAQARLNGKVLQQEISKAEGEISQARLELNKLIGVEPDRVVSLSGSLELPGSQPADFLAIGPILKRRPDYGALLIQKDLARAELVLAHNSRWEDIGLKLFVESEWVSDEPEGLERNTLVGVGVSIPLPLRNKNEVAIDSASINARVADRSREALTFEIRSELEAALNSRSTAYKLAAEASGEIVQLAKKNLEDFRSAHEKGLAEFLEVQKAQEQLLEIRNAALELQREYHLADAQLRYVASDYPELPGTGAGQTRGSK